jgi:hypothetical protein
MKLFVLALIILLIIVILEVTKFYKEGLESGKLDSYVSTTTNSISKSLKSNIDNNTSSLSSFNNDSNKSVSYSPKILGGSLLTVNEEISPYSYTEGQAIIDPNAADLEAARTADADVKISERQLWYGTDTTLKNNFEQAVVDSPMFKVGVIATKVDALYENVVKACSDNTFNNTKNPGNDKEYLYGWDASADSSFPCVGFYSHKGSKNVKDGNVVKTYSILVDCQKNDCEKIGLTESPGGETYPLSTDTKVEEVFRQKATNVGGRKLNTSLTNISTYYEEIDELNNVHIFPQTFTDGELPENENQAMITCNSYSKGGNPCLGLVKVGKNYHYLFSNNQNQKPSNIEIYRKIKTNDRFDYIKVNEIFNTRTITKDSSKRIEGFENIDDRVSEDTMEKAINRCSNYPEERCIGFYKATVDAVDKYYFLENTPVNVEKKNKISQMFKFTEKYDVENEKYKKKKGDNLTTITSFTNDWKEFRKYYNEPENTADNVIVDGNETGDISKFGSSLKNCYNNKFPGGDKDSRKCVGILIEEESGRETKYNFLRFKNGANDTKTVQPSIVVSSTDNNYTKFYPRSIIYDSRKYTKNIKILDKINQDYLVSTELTGSNLIGSFNENKTNAEITEIEKTIDDAFSELKEYLTETDERPSLYSIMKSLEDGAANVEADEVNILFGTDKYDTNEKRVTFIENVEKLYLKMYFIKFYLRHLKFFKEKRIQLNAQKTALKNASKNDTTITQINEYDIDEIKKELFGFSFSSNEMTGYFYKVIKPKIKSEITDVIKDNINFTTDNWVEKIHDEIVEIVRVPIVNMSIKCGGAFHWENMGKKTIDYADYKYEGEGDNFTKCYKSYSHLEDETLAGESCNIGGSCLNNGRNGYFSSGQGYYNSPKIDEILYNANFYFYNQNRGENNNLRNQYTERNAIKNNTPPIITDIDEIIIEGGIVGQELTDANYPYTITLAAEDNEDDSSEITWEATSNNVELFTVSIVENILTINHKFEEHVKNYPNRSRYGEATITIGATDKRGLRAEKNKTFKVSVIPPPPIVTWPQSSDVTKENKIPVTLKEYKDKTYEGMFWEYSIDSGTKWITGKNNAISLESENYNVGTIRVRTQSNDNNITAVKSEVVKNQKEINIDITKPEITTSNNIFKIIKGNSKDFVKDSDYSINDPATVSITYKNSNGENILKNNMINQIGYYTAYFNATDSVGNEADEVSRDVGIIPESPEVNWPEFNTNRHTKNNKIIITSNYDIEISYKEGTFYGINTWVKKLGDYYHIILGWEQNGTKNTITLKNRLYVKGDVKIRAVFSIDNKTPLNSETVTAGESYYVLSVGEEYTGPKLILGPFLWPVDGVPYRASAKEDGSIDGKYDVGGYYFEGGYKESSGGDVKKYGDNVKITAYKKVKETDEPLKTAIAENKVEIYDDDGNNLLTKNAGYYIIEYIISDKAGNETVKYRNIEVVASNTDTESFSNYRLDKYTSNDIFSTIKNIFNRKYYD